jgi:hypothetical protein
MADDKIHLNADGPKAEEAATQFHARPRLANPLLDIALEYANRGWLVFPLRFGTKISHKSAQYSNGARWGATSDPAEIERDFRYWLDANIGLPCGAESGFFVLEVDTIAGGHKHDGAAHLAILESEHGPLPPTLEAESPSGSVHRYYRHPGRKVKCSSSEIGPGIDVKGDDGMVVAPGSIVPNKGVYRWRNDLEIASAPEWLLQRIERTNSPEPASESETEPQERFEPSLYTGDGTRSSRKAYAKYVLTNRLERLAATASGRRNTELNDAAFMLGRLAATGALNRVAVEEALYEAMRRNGYVEDKGERATRATIYSGFNDGLKYPWRWDGRRSEREYNKIPEGAWPFKSAKDFRTDYRKGWIIKNVLGPGEVSTWCGRPGAGKSSIGGDLALHVAAGRDWRGYRSKRKGAIIYFALERSDLVERRLNAQAEKYGIDPKTLPFHTVSVTIDMMSSGCVQGFIETIRAVEEKCGERVIMIVIDTTSKAIAAGCGDENQAKDKGILRANARRVLEHVKDLHVMLISHTGKDEDKLERGSNAGLGDDDMFVLLKGNVAVVVKRNDGPEGVLTPYKLVAVKVGVDEDNEDVTISIVDPDPEAAGPVNIRLDVKLPPQIQLSWQSLINAINDVGKPPPQHLGLPRSVPRVVTFDQWEERCKRDGICRKANSEALKKAIQRATERLRVEGLIGVDDEYVWPAF